MLGEHRLDIVPIKDDLVRSQLGHFDFWRVDVGSGFRLVDIRLAAGVPEERASAARASTTAAASSTARRGGPAKGDDIGRLNADKVFSEEDGVDIEEGERGCGGDI
jgi:hypothetical protein